MRAEVSGPVAVKTKKCRACKSLLSIDRFGRSPAGNMRDHCVGCVAARDARRNPAPTEDAPPDPDEVRRLEVLRLIRAYASVRFDNTPESASAYRALLAAMRDCGSPVADAGRIWRYDRGADDLVTCLAFAAHHNYPETCKRNRKRSPAPGHDDAEAQAQPDQPAG